MKREFKTKAKNKRGKLVGGRRLVTGITLGVVCLLITIHCALTTVHAQTPEWTYQGRLLDSNLPPTAAYDFQFSLWNSPENGTQQGTTQTALGVAVANGTFTVSLNFGAQFDGSARFLQIAVRNAGGGAYTTLDPRQPITSGPYAIRSLNSTTADTATNSLNLGGVAASQYVVTTDPRMTDARPPLPNSTNYIWNQNSVLQPSSNFIISGNGDVGGTLAANIVRATTQYNIGANRVLSVAGQDNTFVGLSAGLNTTGNANSFFGSSAGAANTSGIGNSFFGRHAGLNNTEGLVNSFFGASAGRNNTTGDGNAFFGASAGQSNSEGSFNSFFGNLAGLTNTTGTSNSFFGNGAGSSNEDGNSNSFFGSGAGDSNTTGSFNSFFGTNSGDANNTASENSFFGYNAGRLNTASTNSFFGSSAGSANTTGNGNSFFGNRAGELNTTGFFNSFFGRLAGSFNEEGSENAFFGWGAGGSNTDGGSNSFFGSRSGVNNTVGADNSFFGNLAGSLNTSGGNNTFLGRSAGNANTTGSNNTIIGSGADVASNNLTYAAAFGAGAIVTFSNTMVFGRPDGSDLLVIPGRLTIGTYGSGSTGICRTVGGLIANCSSSLRYKTNVSDFSRGLTLLNKLNPITFNWKDGGARDLGLGAEDVAAIEPLLVTYNKNGEVEGVKYDRIGVIAVNAIKEQQEMISASQAAISELKGQIKIQQAQIDALKKLVCEQDPVAEICKEER